jgi:hypothetical protein
MEGTLAHRLLVLNNTVPKYPGCPLEAYNVIGHICVLVCPWSLRDDDYIQQELINNR